MIALIFVIGWFPSLFTSRMSEGVETVIDHYVAHREQFIESRDATFATLSPRRGGPVESGYPEDPKKKAEEQAKPGAQALNGEAP
jgi:hypothetical protein